MIEFIAVLDYPIEAAAPFAALATPAVMEAHVAPNRNVVTRLPVPNSLSAMAPAKHVAVYECDSGDDPGTFIGNLHSAIYGALGRRAMMNHVPPDKFVRVYFVPVGDDGASAELWEWKHASQEMVKV